MKTETTAVPTTSDVEVTREQKQIEIENTRLLKTNPDSDNTTSDNTTD